ncbi:MAG: hypothetical protein ACTSYX_10370 [Candidatus Thorarchaeota archaeon]
MDASAVLDDFLGIALVSGSNASHQTTAKSDKSLLVVNGAITASTTGDIYSGSGNWVINQSTTYIDEVLTVYGNISINFPGSLTLVNTTINSEPPNDVAYFKANPDTSLYTFWLSTIH